MNIRISTASLIGENDDMLWSGALYGLKRLQEMDHQLFFIPDDLSKQQLALLGNEEISASDMDPNAVDLQVITDNGILKVMDTNGAEIESAKNWIILSTKICFPSRKAFLQRTTSETDIEIALNLDGTGENSIDTGLDFYDHMLEQIAKHGLIDLNISCDGDLNIDEHHTIEDVAICLGQAINQALGDKVGIQRYGFTLPMDESLAEVAIDFSGRPFLKFNGEFQRNMVGDFPTEMTQHFFYSLTMNLKATLHISVQGDNDHHKIEACFKGLARCLRTAVSRNERIANILPSTKDLLE
ncbi:imidazoleglycerol-phosphate dehydratase [Fodinibius salinus]|uniref:Imidazoleglycerol-phosphate dehydratase n=1 Tax=Fodinibius salinus TaxID=860790 RepID=A0A5D3YFS1_9BACT|nr:imidazoleglycerol-phosphate dehydratase HisB [Fodinibius salinus]TYP91981.1 imidazoleglycerol-phosphate dehydratase [Fodinibius salinus]